MGFERDEIDHADRVLAAQEAGAFAWIEEERRAAHFVPMAMGMTV